MKLARLLILASLLLLVACKKQDEEKNTENDQKSEESGDQIARGDEYYALRSGTRLKVKFDENSQSFIGTVENMTEETLPNVRVEIHLSNGMEIGPTTPVDLRAGRSNEFWLKVESGDFTHWSAHAEVGGEYAEHSENHGEHRSEHGEHEKEHEKEHEGGEHR